MLWQRAGQTARWPERDVWPVPAQIWPAPVQMCGPAADVGGKLEPMQLFTEAMDTALVKRSPLA